MRKYMNEINKRIAELRPPKFVPSTPRSIFNYNTWRAHECFYRAKWKLNYNILIRKLIYNKYLTYKPLYI